MKKGEIDAISHLDPVIAKLEADGDIQVLIDTRTEAGTRALFGGSNPAAALYTKKDFIDAQPGDDAAPRQRLREVAEMARRRAKPEDVADVGAGGIPPRRQAALHQGGAELARELFARPASSRRRAWRASWTCSSSSTRS